MKKIIINESQYKRLFKEQSDETKDDSTKLITPPKNISDTLTKAMELGLDLKQTADSEEYKVTWKELGYDVNKFPSKIKENYPIYAPEIISGYGSNTNFNVELLYILKKIEDMTSLNLMISSGNDAYHQAKDSSNHKTGNAIDFYVISGNDDEVQKKIEKAVLKLAMGDYPDISFLNEFKRNTGGTGPHFHIGLMSDINHYHFYDTALRTMDHPHYKCCGKGLLKFTGVGSDIKNIAIINRQKELKRIDPISKKLEKLPPSDDSKMEISKDIKYGIKADKIVDSHKGKKKYEIKKIIRDNQKIIKNTDDSGEKELSSKIIKGLNKLLGTDEV
jgi:hypothetical protein